jgi:hypothetical protein
MPRRFRFSGVLLMLLAILAQPVLAAGSLCSLGHGGSSDTVASDVAPSHTVTSVMAHDHSMHEHHGNDISKASEPNSHNCCDSGTCDMPECSVQIMGLTGLSVSIPVINITSSISSMVAQDHPSVADSLYRPPILA